MKKYVLKLVSGVPVSPAPVFSKDTGMPHAILVQYCDDRAVEDHIMAQLRQINVLYETLTCTKDGIYGEIEVGYYRNYIADALLARLAQAEGVYAVILKNSLNQ